ncbi:MAG TPA: hypothetical protein VMF04_02720 [Thermoplasmata archaeon]|nr:hypothetical protein [Thermoplasmata archaeon]
MVFFEDTGAIIDAPLDLVWKYLASEPHGAAHARSARNFEVTETAGPMSVVAAERLLHGKWTRFVSKSSDFPPLCVVNEEVEGDFEGTRFVILYRPEGNVTRVDVYGDVRSKKFPDAEAHRIFLEFLQGAYEDDAKAIAELRRTGKL